MSLSRRSLLQLGGMAAAVAVSRCEFPPLTRAAVKSSTPILLNSNEKPYGPFEEAMAAMRQALELANRYPDDTRDALLAALTKHHGFRDDEIVLGCGSTEILRAVANGFLSEGKRLIMADPTFAAIAHYAKPTSAEIVKVPLTKTFAHDLEAMRLRAGDFGSLVYICN